MCASACVCVCVSGQWPHAAGTGEWATYSCSIIHLLASAIGMTVISITGQCGEISEELPTESCVIATRLKWSNGFLLAALIKNHLVHYGHGRREGEGKSWDVQLRHNCLRHLEFSSRFIYCIKRYYSNLKQVIPLGRFSLHLTPESIWEDSVTIFMYPTKSNCCFLS